eukprot:4885137-Amphidinium_carterae.1
MEHSFSVMNWYTSPSQSSEPGLPRVVGLLPELPASQAPRKSRVLVAYQSHRHRPGPILSGSMGAG